MAQYNRQTHNKLLLVEKNQILSLVLRVMASDSFLLHRVLETQKQLLLMFYLFLIKIDITKIQGYWTFPNTSIAMSLTKTYQSVKETFILHSEQQQ